MIAITLPGRPPGSGHGRTAYAGAALLLALPLAAAPLDLARLDELALADEMGIQAHEARARAARARAVADGQLPDPVLSVGALNFPVDDFAFDRERMTQLRIGLRQDFPGGDTLTRRREAGEAEARRHDAASALRRRSVLRAARGAWLTLLWRQQERALIEAARPGLEALVETALAGYREGVGSQQDVLRARLEVDALEERLLRNGEALDVARADLARWIGDAALGAEAEPPPAGSALDVGPLLALPRDRVRERLARHPAIRERGARVAEAEAAVGLARAAYGPDWGLEVGYGIRDDLALGGEVPDFLSVAVSIALPVRQGLRQGRRLAAAQAREQAAHAERLDTLRELERDWLALRARHERLATRHRLQRETIAPRTAQTARAALEAYRTDAGDFPEVVRAALESLDVRLAVARLDHELRLVAVELAFLLRAAPRTPGTEG